MKIKDIPRFNRPSSKLLKKGAETLDTAELLSIIFGIGREGESALELSNRLLNKHNLHQIEYLGVNELVNFLKGTKEKPQTEEYVKAMQLLSLIELSKRYNKLVNKGYKRKITCAKDVYNMFVDEMKNYKKEVVKIVLLDTKNAVIKVKDVSVGTLNSSLVHPREVFKEAMKESAASIILVHNHPSGNVNPSKEDFDLTKRLKEVGKLVGIEVMDHIIIGKNAHYSFASESFTNLPC